MIWTFKVARITSNKRKTGLSVTGYVCINIYPKPPLVSVSLITIDQNEINISKYNLSYCHCLCIVYLFIYNIYNINLEEQFLVFNSWFIVVVTSSFKRFLSLSSCCRSFFNSSFSFFRSNIDVS